MSALESPYLPIELVRALETASKIFYLPHVPPLTPRNSLKIEPKTVNLEKNLEKAENKTNEKKCPRKGKKRRSNTAQKIIASAKTDQIPQNLWKSTTYL